MTRPIAKAPVPARDVMAPTTGPSGMATGIEPQNQAGASYVPPVAPDTGWDSVATARDIANAAGRQRA
jgi:hypothetical protein